MLDEIFDVFRQAILNANTEEFDFLTADMSRYTDEDKNEILINATVNAPSIEFYKYIISKGLDVMVKDDHDMTMLHYAGYSSVPEIADYLIRQGIDVNAVAEEHCTPILYAAAHTSNTKVIEVLLAAGADINVKDSTGTGVLAAAAGYNSKAEITEYLLKQGLDYEEKDVNGLTPVMLAALNNTNTDVITHLKNAGADFYAKTPQGGNLLHLAAENPCVDIAEYLSMFFSVYDTDNNGFTPIELTACRNRNPGVMEIMLRCQRAENFFAAILNDSPDMVRYMLSQGCDPNMTNPKFNRPIFCVALNSTNPEIMETLIAAGAILNVKDLWGRNVAHYAAANKDTTIYTYLKDRYSDQIDFEATDEYHNTPEVYKSNPDMIL
ncbi:MAG: ankyrin repeat domain-containing protein [Spirochaetales bacterium]|nr:ankyrin repeat domain-containing protein [Spirochaetales bacterium]